MRIVKARHLNPGDKKVIAAEEPLEDIKFNVFKMNNRPKPTDRRQSLMICCFSEFGCETLGCLYCLPTLMQEHPGRYKIGVGWHGREYFYRHLVDEFWEVKPEHMWLREYCRAFHHDSKNLSRVEEALKSYGVVIPSIYVGQLAVGARCLRCNAFWGTTDRVEVCKYCQHTEVRQSVLGDVNYWKPRAIKIPDPSEKAYEAVKEYVKPKMVGVFARGRTCYGRNLQPEFYVKLVKLLEDMGYNPVWLGEESTTQPCPVEHIKDFSRTKLASSLENTLALVKQCEFTVQFWTASTRLAGLTGVPYLLFESPDQIWGSGQEGFRRNLCDFGPRKLSVNHFLNVFNDNDAGIRIVGECIKEMEVGNYADHMGMVEHDWAIRAMKQDNESRIGG
jgi:hypothetical protein